MILDQLHTVYCAWLWSFPGVAAASFWWWEKQRERNSALRRSFVRSAVAALPGAMLWTEHVTRELAWQAGWRRMLQVHEYPTTAIAVLTIPLIVIALGLAMLQRPFIRAPRGANIVQTLHLAWSIASALVALYFAAGI